MRKKEARARGATGNLVFVTDGHASRFYLPLQRWLGEQRRVCNDVHGRDMYITPPNGTGNCCVLDQMFQQLHGCYGGLITDLKVAYGLEIAISKFEAMSAICHCWPIWASRKLCCHAWKVCGIKDGRVSYDNFPESSFSLADKWERDEEAVLPASSL